MTKERKERGIIRTYKTVDTCAAEFEAKTPYFYSTFDTENESIPSDKKKIMIPRTRGFWQVTFVVRVEVP